ncbi:sialate O-acetylesterase [Anaerocolumna jejuensis]|uniref:sialate O-acetylesterase n=1 Tax=Anaerocolumna jejuensis TaxID=259063 RepID=UPI003F7B620E
MNTERTLRLPRLISDGMVLRQGRKVNIWGFASPGELVDIRFLGEKAEAVADENGKWVAELHDLKPGGPHEMVITCHSGEEIRLKDILIGEVWVCSGQSNMELPISRVADRYPQLEKDSGNCHIRVFKINEKYSFHGPLKELESGYWQTADKNTIMDFSALAYFFAEYMYEAVSIPIGIINASLGGSPAQAWMSEEMLEDFKEYEEDIAACKEDDYIKAQLNRNVSLSEEWYNSLRDLDEGFGRREQPWYHTDLRDEAWSEISLPGFFAEAGLENFTGSLWFRKKIVLSENPEGKDASLLLGTIVDSDEVYVNGVLVGSTPYQYPPRKYRVPEGVLKTGENIITVHVVCDTGNGRFTPGKRYAIITEKEEVSLEGFWKYRVGAICGKRPETIFISWKPTGLYNGMLAPCLDYTITGVLWYQGESNTGSTDNYQELFQKLIKGWRRDWKQEDFPFIFVQLPNFTIDIRAGEMGWQKIREAQRQALVLPNTAMAVTIDLGEDNDLHPTEKKEIARRLSLCARVLTGKEKLEYSGPQIMEAAYSGEEIVLTFSHAQTGIVTQNDSLYPGNFSTAGENKHYQKSEALITGNRVILKWKNSNGETMIQRPEYVRYAFSNSPVEALLYNKEGLPASPFEIKIKYNADKKENT